MRGMNHGFSWNSKTHEASFDVSVTDATGHRHRHRTTEGGHASRADALKAWGVFRDLVRAGQGEQKAWTLLTYWTAHRERFVNVASVVETRILPILGDRLLEKINGAVVRDLVLQMQKTGYMKHGEQRNYSPATLRSTVAVLKMIVGDAVDHEDIDSSPLRGRLRLPIPREVPLRQELSNDEHARFVAAFDDEVGFRRLIEQTPGPVRASDRFGGKPRVFGSGRRPDSKAAGIFFERFAASRPLFVVALETGLRRGDLLALSWKSVDLVNGWIRVARRKTHLESVVPISTACRAALVERQGRPGDGEHVFLTDDGGPFPISSLVRYFKTAKALAGITRRFRFHDLRHTFASRLASEGVSLQVIQKALGHGSARMSERYARPSEDALRTIRKALDGMDTLTDTRTGRGSKLERVKGIEPSTFSLGS